MNIWKRFKNFLKRFFPLTIYRFNQELQKIKRSRKRELQKIQEHESQELQKIGEQDIQALQKIGEQDLQELQKIRKEVLQELQKAREQEILEIQELQRIKKQEIQQIQRIERNVKRIEEAIVRCTPRAELTFEFSLTEHCDLNCAGCGRFSPLAEPEFADHEETTRDFSRLSSLFHGRVKQIRLMGGEPLLHPNLIPFLQMSREKFPDGDISIITNGLRLLNQPEEFWSVCKENKIVIRPTKYPIPLDYEKIEKYAAEHGVEYHYYNNAAVIKTLHFYKLDFKGMQDSTRSFLHCFRANKCPCLYQGRIYPCMFAPTTRHFNKYFGENLKEYPEDSIDIYQAQSPQEILEFLAKPVPFCRYCMIDKIVWEQPWRQSERSIKEWT